MATLTKAELAAIQEHVSTTGIPIRSQEYRVGDERMIDGRRHRVVIAGSFKPRGSRRPRRCADELPTGGTVKIGWLRWKRSSLNCFIAVDLPEARLEIRRHVAWRKNPDPTPWRVVNVFGWFPFGRDLFFATPEEAMRHAGELAAEVITLLEARISRARRRRELHLE